MSETDTETKTEQMATEAPAEAPKTVEAPPPEPETPSMFDGPQKEIPLAPDFVMAPQDTAPLRNPQAIPPQPQTEVDLFDLFLRSLWMAEPSATLYASLTSALDRLPVDAQWKALRKDGLDKLVEETRSVSLKTANAAVRPVQMMSTPLLLRELSFGYAYGGDAMRLAAIEQELRSRGAEPLMPKRPGT